MYASLKSWVNVPFKIRPFLKRNGAGTKVFDTEVYALCYPESDVKLVTDNSGAEVVSTTQLYVDGALSIKVTDEIVFEDETRPIHRINTFYRGGVPDIKVVYL